MSHKNKITLEKQVQERLKGCLRYGHSKHEDKRQGVAEQYIYSISTAKAYSKHCLYFVEWAKQNDGIREKLGHKPRTLEEVRPFVSDWIREREQKGLSAYTLKLEVSALSKLYGEPLNIQTKGTRRADITRSRGAAERDKHFSETANGELINFCRCVGCRRSELAKMKAEDFRILEDGRPGIWIRGKGGRERIAPIIGTPDEVTRALAFLNGLNGKNRVHSGADIHRFRADYAKRVYKLYERPLESLKGRTIDYTAITGKAGKDGKPIKKSALYICRGDQEGTAFDRAAMLQASKALGHNRESVVGEHYLYGL